MEVSVSFTARQLQEREPCTLWMGWVGPKCDLDAVETNPGLPTRILSLYWLSYSGSPDWSTYTLDVLTAIFTKITLICDVTLCNLVGPFRRFGGTSCPMVKTKEYTSRIMDLCQCLEENAATFFRIEE
jgi:hypothetical protein